VLTEAVLTIDTGLSPRSNDAPRHDQINEGGGDPLVDIVIVNWNAGDHLKACLASLVSESERRHIRTVTIVDNGSTDGDLDARVPPDLPVRIDRAYANLGFAAGANRGARQGDAPYILFLNPDARLVPGALQAALAAFGRSAAIGIVGLRLLDGEGRVSHTCSRFPTAGAFAARSLGLDRLPWFQRLKPFMEDWPHAESGIVDQVMGACLILPRKLFDDLGRFDERFFLYYEDVDLAKRAQLANRPSWFEATGAAYHVGGGSSASIPGRRLFYILASRLAYGRKHFHRPAYLLVLFATLALEPWSRLVQETCRRGVAGAAAVATGYGLLLRQMVTGR